MPARIICKYNPDTKISFLELFVILEQIGRLHKIKLNIGGIDHENVIFNYETGSNYSSLSPFESKLVSDYMMELLPIIDIYFEE